MKFLIALSALAAVCSAQVPYPGFLGGPYATAYTHAYAPTFGYAGYGNAILADAQTPASTAAIAHAAAPAPLARTALDVFAPNFYHHGFHPYHNLYAGNAYYGYPHYPYAPAAVAAAPAFVATAPAAAVEAAPAPTLKAVDAPAVEVIEASGEDVAVVEADPLPFQPSFPVHIRQIFPIFPSDLRAGEEDIFFARPDQIIPIKPAVIKEESDELPGVVVAPDFAARSALFNTAVAPAGIVQATQPRFFTRPSVLGHPVIAF